MLEGYKESEIELKKTDFFPDYEGIYECFPIVIVLLNSKLKNSDY